MTQANVIRRTTWPPRSGLPTIKDAHTPSFINLDQSGPRGKLELEREIWGVCNFWFYCNTGVIIITTRRKIFDWSRPALVKIVVLGAGHL